MPVRVNVPGFGDVNFPDSLSEAQIEAEVAKLVKTLPAQPEAPLTLERQPRGAPSALESGHAEGTMDPTYLPLKIDAAVKGAVKSAGKAAFDYATDSENLPTIGGIAGGLAAAPFTGGLSALPVAGLLAGGAAIGGGLGAAGRAQSRVAQGAPEPTAGELAADIGTEAALQGGSQLIGSGTTKAAGLLGKPLYNFALRPGALKRAFPNLAETAIRENVPVSGTGTKMAERLRHLSAEDAIAMEKAADATASPIRANEIMPAFRPAFEHLRKLRDTGVDVDREMAAMAARAKRVAASFGGTPAVKPIPAQPDRIVERAANERPVQFSVDDALSAAEDAWAGRPAVRRYPMGGDDYVMKAEAELGHMADLIPSRVFQPTEAEVRAARQLGSTAATIPKSVLNAPDTRRTPIQFVSPGAPEVPGIPASPGGIGVAQGGVRKRTSQDSASGAYKLREAGNKINDADLKLDEGLAAGYQKAIEARVPGIADTNKRTQELIGLSKALKKAEGRDLLSQYLLTGTATTAAGGHGLMSGDPQRAGQQALAAAMLTHPLTLSRAGIIFGRAGAKSGQIPAAALKMLTDAARQDEQPEGDLNLQRAILGLNRTHGGR